MNFHEIDKKLNNKISIGNYFISFFVYKGNFYWIIDWSEHFNMNHLKIVESICERRKNSPYRPKNLTIDEWRQKMIREFREGIHTLTTDLFPAYRDGEDAHVISTETLRDYFWSTDIEIYKKLSTEMENFLSLGTPPNLDLYDEMDVLNSRLPKFYINYDRRIFIHKNYEREHERFALDGWLAEYGDFFHMIPTSHRYWTSDDGLDLGRGLNFN